MEILYSHRTRSADGQYVHVSALTRALLAQGHGLSLCGPDGILRSGTDNGKKLDAEAGERGGLVARLPKSLYELAEFAYSLPALARLQKAARENPPTIIYERYNLFFLAGLWLKQRTGKPLLVEVNAPLRQERANHGGLALNGLARWAERQLWQGADALLPVTQVLADMLVADGADPAKIHIIPNGIDAGYLATHDPTTVRQRYHLDGKIVLGFTGFVRDWHGVDLILDYMARRKNQPLHLLLVGDGPHVPALRALATQHGLEDRFSVTGVVQRGDMPTHIAAFDIALQPRATAYASPLKLFEYMALSKAIIAPAQANICEVLEDEQNAALYRPEDKTALADQLDRLSADPLLRQRLGQAARQTILDRDMSWAGNARKVIAIAEVLLD